MCVSETMMGRHFYCETIDHLLALQQKLAVLSSRHSMASLNVALTCWLGVKPPFISLDDLKI